jgi:hypothetical protein
VRAKIAWYCFEKPVQEIVEMWKIEVAEEAEEDGREDEVSIALFDHVAILEKGPKAMRGTVQGYKEHREWFGALERAGYPVVKLKLTWKNKERDRVQELMAREASVGSGRMKVEEEIEWAGDTDDDDGDVVMGEDSGWDGDGDGEGEVDDGDDQEVQLLTPDSEVPYKLKVAGRAMTRQQSVVDRLAGGEYI